MNAGGGGGNAPTVGLLNPATTSIQAAVTSWMTGAHCATRPDLPWLADVAPTCVIERMANVCRGCPVMAACDAFVETMASTDTDVCGGFWAGKYRNPAPDVTATRRGTGTQLPLPGLPIGNTMRGVAA